MTRTRHNSPLHQITGTGIVPPLEVLLSVVFCCGWASASLFAFVLGFVFGPFLELLFTQLVLAVLCAVNAVGLRLPSFSHVGYRFISDIEWYALLRICLRLLARSDKKLCDIAGAILDSFSRPEVQWWLVVALRAATALIWIYVLYSVVSLSLYFLKTRSRDEAPAPVEDVQYDEEEQCPCASCHLHRMSREYFWLVLDFKDIYEPITQDVIGSDVDAEVVDEEQDWDTEDWTEQESLGDEDVDGGVPAGWDGSDEEFWDAEEFSEEAGPSDEEEPLDQAELLEQVEPLDEVEPLDGAEPLDEAALLDEAEENDDGVLVEEATKSNEPAILESSEQIDIDCALAIVGSASNAYLKHDIPALAQEPLSAVSSFPSFLASISATALAFDSSDYPCAKLSSPSTSSSLGSTSDDTDHSDDEEDIQPGHNQELQSVHDEDIQSGDDEVIVSEENEDVELEDNEDIEFEQEDLQSEHNEEIYSGDEQTPTTLLLPAPADDEDDPFTSYDAGNAPFHFDLGPNRIARMFSEHFPDGYLLQAQFAGTYVLERELGAGGYGFVMSARHRETGDRVAVKFVKKDHVPHNGWAELQDGRWVPREVMVAYTIDHPNVIKCGNDLFDDDTYLYIIQELHGDTWEHRGGGGNTLWDFIVQAGELPESTARYIFKQIASGVAAMHELGISHCDLKPGNILIDRKLNVKIIDLGSAVLAEPGQEPPQYSIATFCGTIPYTAPEILEGEDYEAAPSDVWSLGLILSELATGLVCNEPLTSPEELREDKLLDDCSEGLQELVLDLCLDVDPARRVTMEELMAHPWMQSD
ncbi:kinase-like protein [Trametopsis cervina]|nr:kinase-like protein [Trametopsis cervina]